MEKRTVNIHGREYEVVASRVERFREDYKLKESGMALITDIIKNEDNIVIVKASIINTITGAVLATGYAEEQRNTTQINKTSALENCETSAIGRALACAGYIGGEYASADEVANAISQQSKPAPKPEPAPKEQEPDKGDELRALILELADGNKKLASDWLNKLMEDRAMTPVKKTSDLDKMQTMVLIEQAKLELKRKAEGK